MDPKDSIIMRLAVLKLSGEQSDYFADEKATPMIGCWNEDGMSLTFYMLADGILEEKQVTNEPSLEKTNNLGFRLGQTQTSSTENR